MPYYIVHQPTERPGIGNYQGAMAPHEAYTSYNDADEAGRQQYPSGSYTIVEASNALRALAQIHTIPEPIIEQWERDHPDGPA